VTALASVVRAIRAETGLIVEPASARRISGGSIHSAFQLHSDRGAVFLKLNEPDAQDLFSAEADGLAALAGVGACAVPRVLLSGTTPKAAFVLLEWLDLSGAASDAVAARLGRALARQHRVAQPAFGWHRGNWIGASAQPNTPDEDWCRFFSEQRLGFQLQLACQNGYEAALGRLGQTLMAGLPELLADHRPPPALLHGDLWAGNWGCDRAGQPYVFDPAVYRGDREADIAMTRLFGGFPDGFYAAYQAEWPLPQGWQQRASLYNLYHVLNHLNLFGGGYLRQAQQIIGELLGRLP
jgi:fructosamine-3-kinase